MAGVALYAVDSDRPWAQVWIPAIAGGLLVGSLTVFAVNIVVNTAVEQARQRQLEPLRVAAGRELFAMHEKVDRFLHNWQYVIGDLRGDYPEVVSEEQGAASFPEPLVSRLPFDTYRLLLSGWGQPNHERVLEKPGWQEAMQIASQVKRQSDRVVQWYSGVLDPPSIVAALGRIQEYLLAAVENMPRTGERQWFLNDAPHEAFLADYRTVWPHDVPTLEAERQKTRGVLLAILSGIAEGTEELRVEEWGRAYEDPVLIELYEAVNPWGPREDYYLELTKSARAMLDLGCGSGRLLKQAATRASRDDDLLFSTRVFVGVDRADSMLAAAAPADAAQSWEESRIVWQFDDVRTVDLGRRFDLITMTGYAFQELLTDGDIRMVLSNVLRHLDPGGRFAFDVHRRDDEPLERLTPHSSPIHVATSSGESVAVVFAPERTIEPDLVEFATTYTFAGSSTPIVSRSVLRFTDLDQLRALLEDVGFRIDRWVGDPNRTHLASSGAEDVVIATYIH